MRARIGNLTTRLQGTWDGQGLTGRLSSGSVAMLGSIAAFGLAIVVVVSAQGWPSGMLGRGITPSQLIELAPGGGDTAVSGNRVAERPPAPASAGSGGGAAVAMPARAHVSAAGSDSSAGSQVRQTASHRRGQHAAAHGGRSGGVTAGAPGAAKHGTLVPPDRHASRPAPAPTSTGGGHSNGNGHAYGHEKNGVPPPTHSAAGGHGRALGHSKSGGHGKALGHSKSGGHGHGHDKK